jgi:hypothetical protein
MKPASLALYSSWKAVKYEKGLKKPLIGMFLVAIGLV